MMPLMPREKLVMLADTATPAPGRYGVLSVRDGRVVIHRIDGRTIPVPHRLVVEDAATDDRSGYVGHITEVDAVADFAVFQVFELIAVAGNRRADDDRDRTQDDVGSRADKLQVEAMRNAIADETRYRRSRSHPHPIRAVTPV